MNIKESWEFQFPWICLSNVLLMIKVWKGLLVKYRSIKGYKNFWFNCIIIKKVIFKVIVLRKKPTFKIFIKITIRPHSLWPLDFVIAL